MRAIRKPMQGDEQLPFKLVYRDTKTPQRELPDHVHDWFELVYVYGGRGTFFINQNFYEIEEGNVFLIPGNTIHCAFPDPDAPVTSTAAFFDEQWIRRAEWDGAFSLLGCYDRAKRKQAYRIETAPGERGEIETILERIAAEAEQKTPGYRQAVLLQLQLLLLGLSRQALAPDQASHAHGSHVSGTQPLWMLDTLAYIDRSLDQDLRLSVLCGRAAVTPAHFSRVFKQLTGMTLTQYVLTKRIVQAMEALVRTDRTLSEIAASCGFESASYFHKSFKRLTGVTPLAYKRAKRI